MNYKVLSSVLVLISCALSSEAYAACTVSESFTSIDINMAVGAVTVLPSDPVGKILVKKIHFVAIPTEEPPKSP